MPSDSSKSKRKAIVCSNDEKEEGFRPVRFSASFEAWKEAWKLEMRLEEKRREKENCIGLDSHPTDRVKPHKKKKKKEEKWITESDSESESSLMEKIDKLRWHCRDLEIGIILPVPVGPLTENDELFRKLCKFSRRAIRKYNNANHTNYEFYKYVEATNKIMNGNTYFITFKAKQAPDVDTTTTFKATVYKGLGSVKPKFVKCLLVGEETCYD